MIFKQFKTSFILIVFSFSIISFFKFNISFSDKEKVFIIILIIDEINEEYIIWGKWYKKLKLPPSTYIIWKVFSIKNKAFTV